MAREIIFQSAAPSRPVAPSVFRSRELAELVGPKDTYAHDLVTHVGLETLLSSRRLQDLAESLSKDAAHPLSLSEQTLWRLEQKFLCYLGALHDATLPALRRDYEGRGGYVLVVDSTCEQGPPNLLVALEPLREIVLGAWIVQSENKAEVKQALQPLQDKLGDPKYVLLDLSTALKEAVAEVFPKTPQKKCHFHFLSVVGQALCDPPQKKLSEAHRLHGLQNALKTLRVDLRRRLLQAFRETQGTPSLELCLEGQVPNTLQPRLLQQEMLLSLHDWIQDYPSDGQREGYPFDPFFLYLHRRWTQASEVLEQILGQVTDPNDFLAFRNLRDRLRQYLADEKVQAAAQEFEESFAFFQKLRLALRLPPDSQGSTPRSEPYDLHGSQEAHPIPASLLHLVRDLTQQLPSSTPNGQRCIRVILNHLEKYRDELQPIVLHGLQDQELIHRTTNSIERFFRGLKRLLRRIHGRKSLRLNLLHMTPELPLIFNLLHPTYLQLALGTTDLGALPKAFSKQAIAVQRLLNHRRTEANSPALRLPKRSLRDDGFLNTLPEVTPHALAVSTPLNALHNAWPNR